MNQEVLKHLNSFLKGEEMAVRSYDRFIKDVGDDEKSRNELQNIRQDHQKHVEILRQRIEMLGGDPVDGTGFAGMMASIKGTMKSTGRRDALDVLKEAYDIEDKSVAMEEELIKIDLDEESRVVLQQILSQDHGHLKRMSNLIGSYEN